MIDPVGLCSLHTLPHEVWCLEKLMLTRCRKLCPISKSGLGKSGLPIAPPSHPHPRLCLALLCHDMMVSTLRESVIANWEGGFWLS